MKPKAQYSDKLTFKKSITICAIDSILPNYSAKAIMESCKNINFDQKILFSNESITGIHKNITIDRINSIAEYNDFILNKLYNYIETDFALIVQWDGFVIDFHQWRDEFLDYDYIGAIWPQYSDTHNIGNGGFSLRSKKLLNAIYKIDAPDLDLFPEDEIICRKHRSILENIYDIKFAHNDVAKFFSHEQQISEHKTFGFHGFWNMLKYIDESEAIDITKSLPKNYFKQYLIMKTFMSSYKIGYHDLMCIIYANIIKEIGEDTLFKTLHMALNFDMNEIIAALKKARNIYVARMINSNL